MFSLLLSKDKIILNKYFATIIILWLIDTNYDVLGSKHKHIMYVLSTFLGFGLSSNGKSPTRPSPCLCYCCPPDLYPMGWAGSWVVTRLLWVHSSDLVCIENSKERNTSFGEHKIFAFVLHKWLGKKLCKKLENIFQGQICVFKQSFQCICKKTAFRSSFWVYFFSVLL